MEFEKFRIICRDNEANKALEFAIQRLQKGQRIQEIILIYPRFSHQELSKRLESHLKILSHHSILLRIYLPQESKLDEVFKAFGIVYKSRFHPEIIFKICGF